MILHKGITGKLNKEIVFLTIDLSNQFTYQPLLFLAICGSFLLIEEYDFSSIFLMEYQLIF